MTAITEHERLAQIHALLTSLDLNGKTTREGTAWGSILRESIEISEAQPVQQPNRDAVIDALAVHVDVPAWWGGKEFGEAADAVLAALAVPATGEAEWEYGLRTKATGKVGPLRYGPPDSFEKVRRTPAGPWVKVDAEPETPEMFPGTRNALDALTIRSEVTP